MTTCFTTQPLDPRPSADHDNRHESLYAAFKAAERLAETGAPPCELVAHGDITNLWAIEIEPGVAVWQGYQFEPCDGFYAHIAASHGNHEGLPDTSHAETGLVRGVNGAVMATYAACRACNLLKIRPIAPGWSDAIDFVTDARA